MSGNFVGTIKGNKEQVEAAKLVIRGVIEDAQSGDLSVELSETNIVAGVLEALEVKWEYVENGTPS